MSQLVGIVLKTLILVIRLISLLDYEQIKYVLFPAAIVRLTSSFPLRSSLKHGSERWRPIENNNAAQTIALMTGQLPVPSQIKLFVFSSFT